MIFNFFRFHNLFFKLKQHIKKKKKKLKIAKKNLIYLN